MPRAKRSKVVHLQATKKKTREHKEGLLEKVKQYLKAFERVYLFEFENLTTAAFKEVFSTLEDSKFCLGKKKVIKMAFGKDENEEPYKNSHLVGKNIQGQVGILFTNLTHQKVLEFFKGIKISQFANPGQIALANIELLPGPEAFKGIPTSNDTYLRKQGLVFDIVDARIVLTKPYVAALKGKPLSIEQSHVLKFLGIKLGEMIIKPKLHWEKKTGKCEQLN